jgi:hypothetical protein
MDYVFMAVGVAVLSGIGSCGLAAIFYTVREWALAKQDERYRKWLEGESAAFANMLSNDAYWFSEDEPTMKLLQDIAARIGRSRGLGYDVSEARSRWRDARVVAAKKTEAKEGSGSPV